MACIHILFPPFLTENFFFYFNEVQIYTLSPLDLAFSIVSKMLSPYPRIYRFFPNVTSSISIVLHFTFWSVTHLEWVFLYFIYLFISCAVSLLLCGLFSSYAEWRLLPSGDAQASHSGWLLL